MIFHKEMDKNVSFLLQKDWNIQLLLSHWLKFALQDSSVPSVGIRNNTQDVSCTEPGKQRALGIGMSCREAVES